MEEGLFYRNIEWGCAPLWSEELRTFFHKSFTEIIILGAVCYFVLEKGIRRYVLIPLAVKFDKKDLWFPMWFTLCDGVDLCFSLYFILFSINELIEFVNGVSSIKTTVLSRSYESPFLLMSDNYMLQ